jgi:lipoprotein NlpD
MIQLRATLRHCLPSATVVVAVLAAMVLSACAGRSLNRAPVEDRGTPTASAPGAVATAPAAGSVTAPPLKPLPGIENAGKPGYYTIKPGDTLIRIGLETGQNWKDIARWNTLDNPNVIEVGQVVRVIPPGTSATAVGKPVAPAAEVTATNLPPAKASASAASGTAAASPTAVATPRPVVAAAPLPPVSSAGDDDVPWIWPNAGAVIAGFDESKNNKGIDIAGKLGDPVLAAGDGHVVYAGAGLRGYGNLIILKHNNTYLTAYAHNQTLLVREDQAVRKGQKIAEMGQSDAERVKLHFEIRRQGKPVDPTRLLPAR